ncbi:glycoside hydrolase family 2 protein [Streptomyces sp. NPDC057382]|uniref:glycoside hydrolase family 2 protein n=1 Tax=unclassified Streptomyces TaxID=2593676 RepID=UPI0036319A3A
MREITAVHDGWQLTPVRLAAGAPGWPTTAAPVPATVPGCVHTDLLAAGLLEDPYLDSNEETQHWIGDSDWRYTTRLALVASPADRTEIVFDGLDTVAEVSLNGRLLARTRNMHRGHRIDLTGQSPGEHELSVVFRAARDHALAVRDQVGERPNVYDEPFQYIRKMACNFGWDWGPTLLTAGIWKDVRLERWSLARLGRVRPQVTVDQGTGEVLVLVDLERAGDGDEDLLVSARIGDVSTTVTVPAGELSARVRLSVPDVELWWPHDMGAQPLYDLAVRLADRDGEALDEWSRRVGFRTVEVRTTPDEHGTPFTFVVNGTEIFVRGVNWIPDDCFPSRITPDRLRARARQAVEANVNLLRVWGGGMYESDDFYSVCDELGILVWQDFLFACSAYPEEAPLWDEVAAEAEENVVRLMPHPSLVLWCGNNENIWGHEDWGWKEELGGRTWGRGYYTDLLPGIVAELDATRAYWPGSPYSGSEHIHPNDPAHGATHIWRVWNELDYAEYRAYAPRFVAEFGFQGPPNWSTLTRAVHDDPLLPDSAGVLAHQKADDGNGKLARGMASHLPEPRDTDDWHYLTQLNQARAVTFGLEHFRSLAPLCRGAIVWQLNDCWPVTSWAAIDGDGGRKPLWYAMRRAYAARLLTVQPRPGGLAVVAVNDGRDPWAGRVRLQRLSFDGTVLAEDSADASVAPGATVTLDLPADLVACGERTSEVLVAAFGTERALWFFAEDRELDLPCAAFSVAAAQRQDGVELTVTATGPVRGLVVQADRLDPEAEADDQVIDLLPGEARVVRIATDVPADDPRWVVAPVLRTVNDIVRAPRRQRAQGEPAAAATRDDPLAGPRPA